MIFEDAKAFADHIRAREHDYGAEAEDLELRQVKTTGSVPAASFNLRKP